VATSSPLRTYEDVSVAAEPGGPLAPDGPFPLTPEQRFSLQHWQDLTESTSELFSLDEDELMSCPVLAAGVLECGCWNAALKKACLQAISAHAGAACTSGVQ
jgi:hypothetical protein